VAHSAGCDDCCAVRSVAEFKPWRKDSRDFRPVTGGRSYERKPYLNSSGSRVCGDIELPETGVIVGPAHGGGGVCGANCGPECDGQPHDDGADE
jgi:hypothetical protein